MRELKYRMWNKKEKKMYQVGVLDFDDEKAYIKNYLSYTVSNYMFEDIELMQFTGLHDKNGKEIYEGDIISNGCEKCIVVWAKECAGFMLKLINKQYKDKEWTNPMIDLRNDEEVIGNIYENSDLLKGADNIEQSR